MTRKKHDPSEPFTLPFTIAIDDRERTAGWRFTGLVDDGKDVRPLIVPTKICHLVTGDYSIIGCENRVVCERKSLSDFYGTLGGGRENFRLEHERMAAIQKAGGDACIIIESGWHAIIHARKNGVVTSRMNELALWRTWISWSRKYKIPWLAVDGKRAAEIACFDFLRGWWEDEQEEIKNKANQAEFQL